MTSLVTVRFELLRKEYDFDTGLLVTELSLIGL